jgi:hypothetical protein
MRNVRVVWRVVSVSHVDHSRHLKVTMLGFSKNTFVRYGGETIICRLPPQTSQRVERFSAFSESRDGTSVISLCFEIAQNPPRGFEDARCFSDDVGALCAIGRAT